MSITGRTSPRWGRDRSARWDPGPSHKMRSYPSAPQPQPPVPAEPKRAELPGRPGAAERNLLIEQSAFLHVSLLGWYTDTVSLNERQARFLRDTLNQWFSD